MLNHKHIDNDDPYMYLERHRTFYQPHGPMLTLELPPLRQVLVPQVSGYRHGPAPLIWLPNPPMPVAVRMPTVPHRPSVHGPTWYQNVKTHYPPNVSEFPSQPYISMNVNCPVYDSNTTKHQRIRRPIKIEKPPELKECSDSLPSQNHLEQQSELTESLTNKNIVYEYKVVRKRTTKRKTSTHFTKKEEIKNNKNEQNKNKIQLSYKSNLKPQPNQQKHIKYHSINVKTNHANRHINAGSYETDKSKYNTKRNGRTQENLEQKAEPVKSVTALKESYESKTVRKEKTIKKQIIKVSEKVSDKQTSVKTYIKNDTKDCWKTTKTESTRFTTKLNTSTNKAKVSHITEISKKNESNYKEKSNVESVSLTTKRHPSCYTKEPFIKYYKKERSKQQTKDASKNLQKEESKEEQNFYKMSSTPDEKTKRKSLDGKQSSDSKTCTNSSSASSCEAEPKWNHKKTGPDPYEVKGSRQDSIKETISRDSGISSLASQFSPSSGSRSSLSNISSSTICSRSSIGSGKDTNCVTVGGEANHDVIKTLDSSANITPENTPTRFSTPCRRPFKRSFNEYSEPSPTSSPNGSAFYTPDSSPNEYGPSAKRFKTKWNDSRSWLSSPDESLPFSPRSRFGGNGEGDVLQPELIGYQMVGDSQFCRFGQQLLGLQRVYMPKSSGRIGICVSGQTISDLHKRVKEKFYPISEKIILMIGTNDFLRSVDVRTMCKELSALITTLQETAKSIVLLTLPPIPKLEKKQRAYHFTLLEQYNTYIRSLDDNDKLRIADVSPLYMTSTPYQKCQMNFFELYFNGPQQRLDMIHLNQAGLEVIRKYILDNYMHK